jgi:membrane protein implicated in regulation of membrane protease activity
MRRIVALSLFAFAFALIAPAAQPVAETVDGTWTASFNTFSGSQKLTWDLVSDGEKLTGKVTNEYGEQKIQDGAIKGNKVAWVEVVTSDGNRTRMKYEGTVKGDKLKLTRTPVTAAVQNNQGPGFGSDFGGDQGDSATAKRTK